MTNLPKLRNTRKT